MTIKLPRNVRIDVDNVPENLEDIVQETFAAYTKGTNPDFTFEDKLLFVDVLMQNVHKADAGTAVEKLILDRYKYELGDQGRLMEPEEFLSIDFMEACYDQGRRDASLRCNLLTDDHHVNEKVMRLLVRVITAVMTWEAGRDPSTPLRSAQDDRTEARG